MIREIVKLLIMVGGSLGTILLLSYAPVDWPSFYKLLGLVFFFVGIPAMWARLVYGNWLD